ncbi:MAG: aminotransferase class I/II-fold pyridoxal phosphate-dependent enzyme [Gemmatimonadetes bacterium]|nr:aminotransferase class I/II-fold pyridoxal phosphate-dependent enzyme [Gemmatimonadota bacterium]
MPFFPFELERWQSTWENRVRHNLSESGVHPLSIRELLELSGGDLRQLADLRMVYSQANGTDELRAAIAALYPGATPDHVLVTTGSAEANFITCWSLIEPGDRVAVMAPTYWQTWGLSQTLGAQVHPFWCAMDRGWEPDPAEIERAITPGTKLVVVTNPGNPTAHVLSGPIRELILARVRATGAWLLADEVYQGAERSGVTTASFWGSCERLIVVNGLSKAYGLPGLRIGWMVGPRETISALWARHDYTVIGPAAASDYLARCALRARRKIYQRTRGIINANYPILEQWLKGFDGFFEWRTPETGAICTVRYRHGIPTLELVERIRKDRSVLLVPGEHFGMPSGYLRIGYGNEPEALQAALKETGTGLRDLLND